MVQTIFNLYRTSTGMITNMVQALLSNIQLRVWEVIIIMVQTIFNIYLTSTGADNQYVSSTIEQHITMSMRGNNQSGSNNIQPISYKYGSW